MIDFEKAALLKLAQIDPRDIAGSVEPLIVPGEQLHLAFKTVRDFVVFTNKRVIAVNVQGMTGKKKDFTSLLGLPDEPLATLPLDRVRPGREALAQMMEELR